MRYVCALLTVEDMPTARAFYESLLGQQVEHDFGENVQFEAGFALHLRSHWAGLLGDEAGPVVPGVNAGELYFEDDDPAAVETRLRKAGVVFVHGVREQPWGQRVLRVRDPDGHLVEVGEGLEALVRRLRADGLSVAGICGRTGLPEAFVAGVIG